MITTEEIAIRVYQMLQESEVKTMISGVVDYERNDYTKEDVIIIPHTITGEGSERYGQINVNILCRRIGRHISTAGMWFPNSLSIVSSSLLQRRW